jgi:4-hydroxybenzoate polyprenyltransferase
VVEPVLPQPVSLARTLVGVVRLAHPFPTALNALLAGLFMAMVSPVIHVGRLFVLTSSVAAIHGAIGSLNDYCDYELDASGKPSKPLVSGLLKRSFARSQAFVLGATGLWLSYVLGGSTVCFAIVVLLAGAWYDVWAKRTLVSWLPFAIFVPSLPLWALAASGRFERALLFAYPLGVLLSLGLNLTNTLPDLEADTAHGLHGLAHKMGVKRGIILAWASFAGAILGLLAAQPLVGNDWTMLSSGLVGATLLLALMMGDYAIFRSPASLKRTWYVSSVLSALIGLAWVASLPRVTHL